MKLESSDYEWVEIDLAFSPEHAQWFVYVLTEADIPVYVEMPSFLTAVGGHLAAPHRIYVPREYEEAAGVVLDAADEAMEDDE